MSDFGATWRGQPDTRIWDEMWARHRQSAMTLRMLEEIAEHERVVEVGAGAGHMAAALVAGGWSGKYLGFEISPRAAAHAARALRGPMVHVGDFVNEEHVVEAIGFRPTLVFSRGVLQHHLHWAPMVVAALRAAPLVLTGLGYVNPGKRHQAVWKDGHYDTSFSVPLMRAEAAAMGLSLKVRAMPRPDRPQFKEALAHWRRP